MTPDPAIAAALDHACRMLTESAAFDAGRGHVQLAAITREWVREFRGVLGSWTPPVPVDAAARAAVEGR